MMRHVVPAVLPKSRAEMDAALVRFSGIPGISRIQIDVVDGKFATPASWPYNAPTSFQQMLTAGKGLPYLEHIAYEIDLMCLDAEDVAGDWIALGATHLTFHAESTPSLPHFLERVRQTYGGGVRGLLSLGVALNVSTDPVILDACIEHIEYVQFMGIGTIGRQGEPFDPRVLMRIRDFRKRHPNIPIQVDGGVSLANAPLLLSAGVTDLVVGSAILRATDPSAAFAAFETLVDRA